MMKFRFIYLVTGILLMSGTACFKETDYNPQNRGLDSLFTLNTDRDSVPADGVSKINCLVSGLPDNITDSDNVVLLQTDYGTFAGQTGKTVSIKTSLQYDSGKVQREAKFVLVSEAVTDSVHLTVTIKGVTKLKTLYFYPAFPDHIRILPSLVYFHPSFTTGVQIEVDLLRDTGIVSLKTPVTIAATDDSASGKTVGYFQNSHSFSDSNGKCMFEYFFADTLFKGNIFLKASTTYGQQTVSDTTSLIIY